MILKVRLDKMSKIVNKISYAMSLREPQIEALSILDKIVEPLNFKSIDKSDIERLKTKNEVIAHASLNCEHPRILSVTEEFSFPSFAFEMATGIGKTRLMGASIYYLYK